MRRKGGRVSDERALAIQFSDLRGFTSFTAQRGDQEAFRISRDFVDLVGEGVERHGGRLHKTYGDGVMTSFDSAAEAVICSAEVQRSLCERYCTTEEEPAISAGVGLAWGEAIRTEGDLFGHSVNLAKRLADVAKGGQIVASPSVLNETGTLKSFEFRDLGERDLKGIGLQRMYEIIWREEAAKLSLSDDSLDFVLTEDNKLVLEFAKQVKEQVLDAMQKLEEEIGDSSGLSALIKRSVAQRLAKHLPRWIDWAQARAGMGIEHPLRDVEAEIQRGRLVVSLAGRRRMEFGKEQIDSQAAEEFVARLKRMKASTLAEGDSG